jgi:hypothetical protein
MTCTYKLYHFLRERNYWGPLPISRGETSLYLAGFIIGVISYYIEGFWGLERDSLVKFVRYFFEMTYYFNKNPL